MLGALAKTEEPCGEACLFFFPPTTRQMAATIPAKKLGWIQHVVMEEKFG